MRNWRPICNQAHPNPQFPPPPAVTRHIHLECNQACQLSFSFLHHGSKKLASFPHNGKSIVDFGETKQRKEVAHQKVNPILCHTEVIDKFGDISRCYSAWEFPTKDPFVLDIVKSGIRLDFSDKAFCSNFTPQCSLSPEGVREVTVETTKLLVQKVVATATLRDDSFVSSIFTTKKADGSHRTILNLKNLNESINYVHFKMESLNNVRHLLKPGVWMGSIDLKDAYYSVRVNPCFQKYFTCYWQGCYYEFLRMSNGYAQAPLLFTKLLRQPFGFLRLCFSCLHR